MKLYIGICSARDWKPQFGASLCALVKTLSEDNVSFFLNVLQGTSVIPRARQLAIEDAIAGGFTHILMIDDDISFPPNLVSVLSHYDVPIIGVNYTRKVPAQTPMCCGLDGQTISSKDKSGIEEIGWLGFGAVMIEVAAIKDIPKPWFEMRWLDERQDFLGEDYYFCMKARSHGLKIHLNHDLKCSHIGDYNYREI